MAEVETAPGPVEKPLVVDHHQRESVHSSNDEKASHKHEQEHRDNEPAPGSEKLSDVYDPNVYAGVPRLRSPPR